MCEDVIEWKERGLALMTCDANRRKWNTVMVLSFVPDNEAWELTVGPAGGSKSKGTVDLG